MRHTIAAAFVFGLTATQALAAGTVSVPMDEVRTVTFPRPVTTVFMGNSTIADVNLVDSRHAFVLGKVFGTTNLIALDSSGHEISNVYVAVPETRGSTVTVFHGVLNRNRRYRKDRTDAEADHAGDKNHPTKRHRRPPCQRRHSKRRQRHPDIGRRLIVV